MRYDSALSCLVANFVLLCEFFATRVGPTTGSDKSRRCVSRNSAQISPPLKPCVRLLCLIAVEQEYLDDTICVNCEYKNSSAEVISISCRYCYCCWTSDATAVPESPTRTSRFCGRTKFVTRQVCAARLVASPTGRAANHDCSNTEPAG